jgi:hypothetical protein
MPITRRLMKPGSWSVKLRPDAPHSVFSRINQFDQIVVLPTRLEPVSGFPDASLRAAAHYVGVITKKPTATDLSGHGLEWYLGTPKGYGPGTAGTQGLLTTAVTQSAATLSTWVAALCPPALTVGTVTNGSLATLSDSFGRVTRREALDAVCRQIGAEYRVNPNGSIDAAAPSTLFGSSATVVVTSKEEGRDGPFRGLEGSLIVTASDVDDYITRAIVVTQGEGAAASATTVSGTASFRDYAGNVMHVERYIDAPTSLAANAGLIGTAAVNKLNAVRRDLRLSSRTYNVSRFAEPGDFIFVYDPVQGLRDQANQIIYRGEVLTPMLLRVFGLTSPIEDGMGVYVRQPTGVGTANWIDVSDWVMWETSDVQWEVGAPRRPLTGTSAAQNEGTVAYLGVNPAVAGRTAGPEAWTPLALTSPWVNYGGTWIGASIRRVGDLVSVRGLIAGGTSGSAIATLPVGRRPAGDLPPVATAVDVGAGNQFARLDVYMSGSMVAYFPAGTAAYLSIDVTFSVS